MSLFKSLKKALGFNVADANTPTPENHLEVTFTPPVHNDPVAPPITNTNTPLSIEQVGLLALEAASLVATSENMEVVKSNYAQLKELLPQLVAATNQPDYAASMRNAIDEFSIRHEDEKAPNFDAEFVLKPAGFDLENFFTEALSAAFMRDFNAGNIDITTVKNENAPPAEKEINPAFKDILQRVNDMERMAAGGFINNLKDTHLTDEGYVVNPTSVFKLTLLGADAVAGAKVREVLQNEKIWRGDKIEVVLGLLAQYNLKVKEVEEYKAKHGKAFFSKMEELKNATPEWNTLTGLTKKELLEAFSEEALNTLTERADCNLYDLFTNEPDDFTIDDALLHEYGYDCLRTYMQHATDMDKVRVIVPNNYYRAGFEKLTEAGLAIRGTAIPLPEILSTLTLKELNALAGSTENFKRKNKAIDFIMAMPDAEEKISGAVAFRDLFKLNALPAKYAALDMKKVAGTWSYTRQVATLLVDTYTNAAYATEALTDPQRADTFWVEYWAAEDRMCPCLKNVVNRKFTRESLPRIPAHVGCNGRLKRDYVTVERITF